MTINNTKDQYNEHHIDKKFCDYSIKKERILYAIITKKSG